MKKLVVVLLTLLLLNIALVANATSVSLPGVSQSGGWVDVNKTWDGDSNMCWAASAADMLAYEGWTTTAYPDGQAIYNDLRSAFPNQPGSPIDAISWYLRQNFPSINPYSTMSFNSSAYNTIQAIDQYLSEGYAISAFVIRLGGGAHDVTVWGDDGSYLTITDSDDGYYGEKRYPYSWDATHGWYEFNMYFGLAYLGEIIGLSHNQAQVPEPNILLLLCCGLFGLAGFRKSFEK